LAFQSLTMSLFKTILASLLSKCNSTSMIQRHMSLMQDTDKSKWQ
jgi:hypothetical protein